jgi:hypothetical protein
MVLKIDFKTCYAHCPADEGRLGIFRSFVVKTLQTVIKTFVAKWPICVWPQTEGSVTHWTYNQDAYLHSIQWADFSKPQTEFVVLDLRFS